MPCKGSFEEFSDGPPLGKLAPSGGSEDTPVPSVGATASRALIIFMAPDTTVLYCMRW